MSKLWRKIDKPLFFITLVLSLFGLLMIFSASSVSTILRYNVSSSFFFTRQLLFLILSYLVAIIFIFRIPTKRYIKYIIIAAIGILALLVGLFAYSSGSAGVSSWYDLGFFSLQPSEFAKSVLIIFSAVYYNRVVAKKSKKIYIYFVPVLLGLIYALLIIFQPDMGSAAILIAITFFMFMALPTDANKKLKIFKLAAIIALGVAILLLCNFPSFLSEYQLKRFEFSEPCTRYTEDTGYQVCNGFIAIKNGGLFGSGLGNSTQKYLYLPESHTDFIFPIIVEELGLVTGIILIFAYCFLLFRILKIARNALTLRGSLLAYGAFCLFASHILINLLGILALMPLTGVPLPLLSYGGSSTINFMLMIFIVQKVAMETKEEKMKKELSKI